jgi:hypothetical protein
LLLAMTHFQVVKKMKVQALDHHFLAFFSAERKKDYYGCWHTMFWDQNLRVMLLFEIHRDCLNLHVKFMFQNIACSVDLQRKWPMLSRIQHEVCVREVQVVKLIVNSHVTVLEIFQYKSFFGREPFLVLKLCTVINLLNNIQISVR